METRYSRQTRANHDSCSTQEPSPEAPLQGCLRRSSSFDKPAKPLALQSLVTAVEQLYSEFLDYFSDRKDLRLESSNHLAPQQRQSLKIEREYRHKLSADLGEYSDSHVRLKEKMTESALQFVSDLGDEVNCLKGQNWLLRAICITDAYATLVNACSEISSVLISVFKGSSLHNLMHSAFYEEVLRFNFELVEYASENKKQHWSLKKLARIEKGRAVCCLDDSSDGEHLEALQGMTVDELVGFINGAEGKKRKKKRKKKGETGETEDCEVERLMRNLEQEFLPESRLKACVSDEYIDSLRKKIRRIKISK